MLTEMTRLALSAIGRDRPGIVAGMTAVLLRHGVNVEDSQMAILRGHFAMTLILAPPDDVDREALAQELDEQAAELGLEALALSGVEPVAEATPEPTHLVIDLRRRPSRHRARRHAHARRAGRERHRPQHPARRRSGRHSRSTRC